MQSPPPKNPWPTKTHHQLSSAWGDCAPAQTRRPRTLTLSCLRKRGEGRRPHRERIPARTLTDRLGGSVAKRVPRSAQACVLLHFRKSQLFSDMLGEVGGGAEARGASNGPPRPPPRRFMPHNGSPRVEDRYRLGYTVKPVPPRTLALGDPTSSSARGSRPGQRPLGGQAATGNNVEAKDGDSALPAGG